MKCFALKTLWEKENYFVKSKKNQGENCIFNFFVCLHFNGAADLDQKVE